MGLDEFRSPNAQTRCYRDIEPEVWERRKHESEGNLIRNWLRENDSIRYVCSRDMTDELGIQKRFITYYLRDMDDAEAWNPESKSMTVYENPYWNK